MLELYAYAELIQIKEVAILFEIFRRTEGLRQRQPTHLRRLQQLQRSGGAAMWNG